jgi:hypothetical protein
MTFILKGLTSCVPQPSHERISTLSTVIIKYFYTLMAAIPLVAVLFRWTSMSSSPCIPFDPRRLGTRDHRTRLCTRIETTYVLTAPQLTRPGISQNSLFWGWDRLLLTLFRTQSLECRAHFLLATSTANCQMESRVWSRSYRTRYSSSRAIYKPSYFTSLHIL